ncbi:MAG: HDIG domain-containing protein [Anaerolineales bacterium]|jgi:putative nucleotidyltransferase with HDIG domain
MTLELTNLIPEFNTIEDTDLRERTIAVWEEALELGGWTLDQLKTMPYTLLIENVEITFPEHVSVVCRLCLAMESVLHEAYGARYRIERDTLIAGALLADVGKLLEFTKQGDDYVWSKTYRYLRHPFTGVALARKHGLPEPVQHIIATHSWEGDRFQRQAESIIFHHADFTDFDLTRLGSTGG